MCLRHHDVNRCGGSQPPALMRHAQFVLVIWFQQLWTVVPFTSMSDSRMPKTSVTSSVSDIVDDPTRSAITKAVFNL